LPNSRKIKDDVIIGKDNGDPEINQPLFLLNCELDPEDIVNKYPKLWDYLKTGEESTASKYLCSKRKRWYYQEKREPAPILCAYTQRKDDAHQNNAVRFILNRSSAIATNSFHMLYPTELFYSKFGTDQKSIGLAWRYLSKLPSGRIFDEGRIYGGGLHKIEPRELSKVDISGIEEFILSEQNKWPPRNIEGYEKEFHAEETGAEMH
jgi:hypothetical protein